MTSSLTLTGLNWSGRCGNCMPTTPKWRFHLISSIVAGAYLAGDHIRQLVGYPGQFRQPAKVDDAANELADGILDPVLAARGDIYISAAGE